VGRRAPERLDDGVVAAVDDEFVELIRRRLEVLVVD
jgi:hypothetical protein